MRKTNLLICFVLTTYVCLSQSNASRPEMKFGSISPEDFAPTAYSIDSSAHAVILFDYMKAEYESDNIGGFNIIYKYHRRVRLMNKNGFDEATVEIPFYVGNKLEDELKKLEAVTYNLENGKVEKVKIDKSSIFKDKVTKGYYVKKFTFPALKEGSIIEYQYTVISPFEQNLQAWVFQDTKYPTLWSEYDVTVPDLYNFLPVPRHQYQYAIQKQETNNQSYSIVANYSGGGGGMFSYNAVNTRRIWAMNNLPALKEESYTTTLDNYVAQINFYLLSINYPQQTPIPIIKDWYHTAQTLLKNENFGAPIFEANNWMKDDLAKLIEGVTSDEEKVKKIYHYVRDNFECTSGGLLLSQNLKKTFNERKGNRGDINLLLTAMYHKAGYKTNPVLLSTRKHGKPYEVYPILDQFDYLVTRIETNTQTFLLDASDKKNAFNKLPARCYNGSARVIDEQPVLISLTADSLIENKLTTVFLAVEGDQFSGAFASSLGYYESIDLREKIAKETQEDFFKSLKKKYPFEVTLENPSLDSLKNNDYPVSVKYDFRFPIDEDILYITPLFSETEKENPFKSVERLYPIEMPYRRNETFILNMDVPEGYVIDELPKSARIKLNEDEGMFEYIINGSGSKIQLRSKIILNKANFLPEDYATLRDFYAFIVKKHSEQVVLKKAK